MITLKIAPLRLEAQGHAGYGERGRDIVCAAVSTLFSALSLGLERQRNYGRLEWLVVKLNDGSARISAKPISEHHREVQLLFDVFAQALVQIADQYPEYVRVAP